ncbi:MAG: hypothetical protein OQK79_05990 [Rhodanobacter sp.]|nr:hypothetical protein [Rhodanobacter sp.]
MFLAAGGEDKRAPICIGERHHAFHVKLLDFLSRDIGGAGAQ